MARHLDDVTLEHAGWHADQVGVTVGARRTTNDERAIVT
jgi:hypothetical protein